MPNDPTPLTEAEREFLAPLVGRSVGASATRRPDNANMIRVLSSRGLLEPSSPSSNYYWIITDAGRTEAKPTPSRRFEQSGCASLPKRPPIMQDFM